eukprot:4075335-Amphidinium_carterae.1
MVQPVVVDCGHALCRRCFLKLWLPRGTGWTPPKCKCNRELPLKLPAVCLDLKDVQEALGENSVLAQEWKETKLAAQEDETSAETALRCPHGYTRGDAVVVLAEKNVDSVQIHPGDEGVVLGPAANRLVCRFSGSVITLDGSAICRPLPLGLR